MDVIYARSAGLDVHKKTVVASRTQPSEGGGKLRETATFGTMTADLLQLVDWLHAWGITHVAMESTGDY
jgi:transposase